MVYRGIMLGNKLREQGNEVIEVYPYASKVRLFGRHLLKKTTADGIAWLRERLSGLFMDTYTCRDKWNHDLCDAAVAAYTGFLYICGDIEALGDPEEGLMYIPSGSCDQKEVD